MQSTHNTVQYILVNYFSLLVVLSCKYTYCNGRECCLGFIPEPNTSELGQLTSSPLTRRNSKHTCQQKIMGKDETAILMINHTHARTVEHPLMNLSLHIILDYIHVFVTSENGVLYIT